jgi:hypothetical protein
MPQKPVLRWALLASSLPLSAAWFFSPTARAQSTFGEIRGVTRAPGGLLPMPQAQVIAHGVDEIPDRVIASGADGTFSIENLKPGHYLREARKEGFASSRVIVIDLATDRSLDLDLTLGPSFGWSTPTNVLPMTRPACRADFLAARRAN